MMVRTGLLSAALAGALAAGGAAEAADIYRGAAPHSFKDAPVYAPVSSWAGFYIGGNLGGAIDIDDADFTNAPDNVRSAGDDELIGGVHAGYNWQGYGSRLVFGVEGDLNFADTVDYLASIRGRLGLGSERALFYVTAGVAFIDGLEESVRVAGVDVKIERDGDDVGFVVGGGAEFKLTSNWSLGVEGLYYNFDGDESVIPDYTAATYDNEAEFWTVRGRVSYHFNRPAAPLEGGFK